MAYCEGKNIDCYDPLLWSRRIHKRERLKMTEYTPLIKDPSFKDSFGDEVIQEV